MKNDTLLTSISFRIIIILGKDLSLKTANAMSMKGDIRNSTFLRGARTPKARRKYSCNKRLNASRARREVRLQPGSLTSHLALCTGTCTPDGAYVHTREARNEPGGRMRMYALIYTM